MIKRDKPDDDCKSCQACQFKFVHPSCYVDYLFMFGHLKQPRYIKFP
jgi:hypothetical protein